MTEAEKFAAVFRGAADGARRVPEPGGGYSIRYYQSGDKLPQEEIIARAFSGIADIFEKIAKAEKS